MRSDRRPPSSSEDNVLFVDRYLEKHITPVTLNSNIKRNPLYTGTRSKDSEDNEKSKPAWTVKEYDTQTLHGNLTHYLKVIWGEEESLWMTERMNVNLWYPNNESVSAGVHIYTCFYCPHRRTRRVLKIWTSGWRISTHQDLTLY